MSGGGRRLLSTLLLALVLPTLGAVAQASAANDQPSVDERSPSDAWHRAHHGYFFDEESPPAGPFQFGLCPSLGIQAGTPGSVMATGELYLSLSRPRSFSFFAGVGAEGTNSIRAITWTLGWGGVREIHGARYQTGFFGAFLRYRNYRGEASETRRDALSAGTEIGGGNMALVIEIGGSRRTDGQWHPLAYLGFKLIHAFHL